MVRQKLIRVNLEQPINSLYRKYATTYCLHSLQEFFHDVRCQQMNIAKMSLDTLSTIFNFLRRQSLPTTLKDSFSLNLSPKRRFCLDSEIAKLGRNNVSVYLKLTVPTLTPVDTKTKECSRDDVLQLCGYRWIPPPRVHPHV